MTIQIADQYNLDISVAGESLPLDQDFIGSLTLMESIHNQLPSIELVYNQPVSLLYESRPLTGMEKIEIELSKQQTDDQVFRRQYRCLHSSPVKSGSRRPNAPAMKIKGLLEPVKHLQNGQHRGVEGTPSDVVENVVSSVADSVRTDPSRDRQNRSWVQPGWINSKFLHYLEDRAVSRRGFGDYYAFFRSNKDFQFRTMDSMYQEPTQPEEYSKVVFTESETNKNRTNPSDLVSNKELNLVVDYNWVNDLSSTIDEGTLGFNSYSYDWRAGEYTGDTKYMDELTDHVSLTDRSLYRSEQYREGEFSTSQANYFDGFKRYSGETEDRTKEQILRSNNNTSQLVVTVRGRMESIYAGDKIEVAIVDNAVSGEIQQVLSGHWIVANKTESILEEYHTKMVLTRDGLNSPQTQPFRFNNAPGQKL